MGLRAVDKSGRDREVDLDEATNAAMETVSGGIVAMDPTTHQPKLVPKSKTDWAVQAATLPLFLYGGPEAKEGAGLLERGAKAAVRAGVTGAETVGSDLVRGLVNKFQGKPSGLSAEGEAGRFATGAGVGTGLSLTGRLLRNVSGLSGAETEAANLNTRRGEAYSKTRAEDQAVKRLRSMTGATAPGVTPTQINDVTRDAQTAVGHSIGTIHKGINDQYQTLFAPYKNNPIEAESFTQPVKDFQAQLQSEGRDRQLGGGARKLLNDAANVGTEEVQASALNVTDPAVARRVLQGAGVPAADIAGMSNQQIILKANDYVQLGSRRVPISKPLTVKEALTYQSRANAILMSRSASANDKAVASAVSRAAQGSLDALDPQMFLSNAEKQQHASLKAQTRSFYTDLGDLFVGKAKTPAEVGAAVFDKQPAHVVSRIVDAATPQERESLRRGFADWAIPEGADISKVVPKLAELDQSGVLKKLYPGRYGQIADWASTFRAQEKLKQMAGTPAGAAEIAAGERTALQSPEGRRFLDRYRKELGDVPPNERAALDAAMAQGAKGGMVRAAGGHGWMLRYAGLIAPIEALLGFGLWRSNPLAAGVAFSAFMGTAGWKAAMRNDATRAAFLDAIEDPNVRRQSARLARLAMGLALTEMKQQPEAQNAAK